MRENKNKTGLVIGILLLVIVVLLIIVVYSFVVRPAITSYVVNVQNQGYDQGYATAIVSIMERASQCQPVPLILGNQTMDVIWIECLRQQVPLQ